MDGSRPTVRLLVLFVSERQAHQNVDATLGVAKLLGSKQCRIIIVKPSRTIGKCKWAWMRGTNRSLDAHLHERRPLTNSNVAVAALHPKVGEPCHIGAAQRSLCSARGVARPANVGCDTKLDLRSQVAQV